MVKKLKQLLRPFSVLYGGVMSLRNVLYDKSLLQAHCFGLPVIAVGNLTVGGTGKTPHVEYLLRLLQPYRVATLSRGYKRSTSGFVLANPEASAASIGDEPFQYYQDFSGVSVAVCEDRVKGVQQLLEQKPDLGVIVLDDAMQHRPIQPSLNLLITDFQRPFYQDYVLPAGLLREPRSGASRADAIIVSKCPDSLQPEEKAKIETHIRKYARSRAPIFFTAYRYAEAVGIGNAAKMGKEIVLMTGIANANPLKEYLTNSGYTIRQHLAFPDHHRYTLQDMQRVLELFQQDNYTRTSIVTTRKDAVKLTSPALSAISQKLPLFYVPIEVVFLGKKAEFDQFVLQHVREKLKPVG